ncbi:MAG: hypothetical protein V1816_18680 [Pseudomonadota bacterium]
MTADFLSSTELVIPLDRLMIYLVVISFCLLLKRSQLGLAVTFLFVLYLGYWYNQEFLKGLVEGSVVATVVYFGSGLILLVLAIVSFFQNDA